MNNKQANTSPNSTNTYHPRWAARLLRARLESFPVVVLAGPRQVGKSTLLRHEEPTRGWPLVDLDDLEARGRVEDEPGSAWAGVEQIVVDEVQRVPTVLEALKAAVDRPDRRLRAVLSGSANLLLMRAVSESLAGRAAYLELGAPTLGERSQEPEPTILEDLLAGRAPEPGRWPALEPEGIIQRGLMPALWSHPEPVAWWDAYVRTYLERDLRALSAVHSLSDFRRLMARLALHTGAVLNTSELGRQLGISQATVHRWVDLLEVSQLLHKIPAFAENRGKRVTKRPKIAWADPGLAAFLAGFYSPGELTRVREAGAFFEALVYHHLRVLASLMTPPARVFHWRSSDGKEVDFVVVHGRRMIAIECKRADRVRPRDLRHLRLFQELHPECAAGVVVHTGAVADVLGEGLYALPWSAFALSPGPG